MGGSVVSPGSGYRPRPVQAFVGGGFRLQTCAAKGRRAACGVSSLRMSVMEKERMAQDFKDVDTRVIGALEKLGSRRLTVADVSSVSGTPVQETEKELLLLSQLTGGKLEVSDDGDIVYTFDNNVRATLMSNSLRASIREQFEKAWPVLFYLIRVSFGAFLFISILTVFAAISIISSSSSDRDRGERRGDYYDSGPGFGMGFFRFDLFDFFYWSSFQSTYYGPQPPKNELNFLEAIFSFVFGDGDPNRGLEDKRWRAVAATIRANNGAVTAEQLAPLLDPPEEGISKSETSVDESYVIPALLRFQGRPEVTPDGDIIYVFPEMAKSGLNVDTVRDTRGQYIEEDEWEFSKGTGTQKFFVVALAILNLTGVVTLGGLLGNPVALRGTSPGLVSTMQALFPLLTAYATTYFTIPVFRWMWQSRENVQIRFRNSVRKAAASLFVQPSEKLRRKEFAARQYATERNVIGDRNMSFSSGVDVTPSDEDVLGQFDRKISS